MNKTLVGLVITCLLCPFMLRAQTDTPADWRKQKTCPAKENAQEALYNTLQSSNTIKDTRYLVEKCGADINWKGGAPLAEAVLAANYPAVKYLLPKTNNPTLAYENMFNASHGPENLLPPDYSPASWKRICNLLAKNIVKRNDPTDLHPIYALYTDHKTFTTLFAYAKRHTLFSPQEMNGQLINECRRLIYQTRHEQEFGRVFGSPVKENVQENCRFIVKNSPDNTMERLTYLFIAQPEKIPFYLTNNTAPWILAQALETAPETYWSYLLGLGAKAKWNALTNLFGTYITPQRVEMLLQHGAANNTQALENFIDLDNDIWQQTAYVSQEDKWANAPYDSIRVLLKNGLDISQYSYCVYECPKKEVACHSVLDAAQSPKTKQLLKEYGAKTAAELAKEYKNRVKDFSCPNS